MKKESWLGLAFIPYMIFLAIGYGIAHDLVTAHVCVEYFTVYHPKLIEDTSPVAMALFWGFVATWWVGLIGGFLLFLCNVVGRAPKLEWGKLYLRCLLAMCKLWLSAMLVLGLSAVIIANRSEIMTGYSPGIDVPLISVGITHSFSYLAAALTVAWLAISTVWSRYRLNSQVNQSRPEEDSEN